MLTLAPMEMALILGAHSFGATLINASAAVPSVAWEWMWALLEALRLPTVAWAHGGLRGV